MPEYLSPGLFVEEIDSGSKPIEGVGTNTTAFIGYAKSGDFNKPTFISNWTQFVTLFGQEENAIVAAPNLLLAVDLAGAALILILAATLINEAQRARRAKDREMRAAAAANGINVTA